MERDGEREKPGGLAYSVWAAKVISNCSCDRFREAGEPAVATRPGVLDRSAPWVVMVVAIPVAVAIVYALPLLAYRYGKLGCLLGIPTYLRVQLNATDYEHTAEVSLISAIPLFHRHSVCRKYMEMSTEQLTQCPQI